MKYETICFDIDGTLYPPSVLKKYILPFVFFHPYINKTYSALRNEFRLRQDGADFSVLNDKSFSYKEAFVLKEIDDRFKTVEEARDFLDKKYYFRLLKRYKKIGRQEDVTETLGFLEKNKVNFAFLSDWPLGDKLERLGIEAYKDRAYTADDTGFLKPSVKGFSVFLEKAGIRSNSVLYVGDSYDKDVLGAVNAGMDAVLINCKTVSLADEAEICSRFVKNNRRNHSVNDKNPGLRYPKAKAVFKDWNEFDLWLRKMYIGDI